MKKISFFSLLSLLLAYLCCTVIASVPIGHFYINNDYVMFDSIPAGQAVGVEPNSKFLAIYISSVGSFEITDPSGKRFGFDIETKKAQREIPNIQACTEYNDNDDAPPCWMIELYQLIEGKYYFKIWNVPSRQYEVIIENQNRMRKNYHLNSGGRKLVDSFEIYFIDPKNFTVIKK